MIAVQRVKRIQMARTLEGWRPRVQLPAGYRFVPWQPDLADTHAAVMYRGFAGTIDAEMFPNLGSLSGCRMLMWWATVTDDFCPQATWLVSHGDLPAGTIQCTLDRERLATILNLAVLPEHCKIGLGTQLIAKAIESLQGRGASKVTLEVTAANPKALRLYRRAGFKPYNSHYRTLEPRVPS